MPFVVSYPADGAPRIEGDPFYGLARYTYQPGGDGDRCLSGGASPPTRDFSFDIRCFRTLPPSDAVGLLNGDDETGLVVWAGALGMAEWLLQEPARVAGLLYSPPHPGERLAIVELGCGSGVLAVALHKLLAAQLTATPHSPPPPPPLRSVELVATDGNPQCVALCQRNLQEQCPPSAGLCARAARLCWGRRADGDAIALPLQDVDRLALVSADVIYDAAAVPLLVAAATQLREDVCDRAPAAPPTSWWLLYTPRSLTRASNEAIYDDLVAALAAHPTWQVRQHPLPTGCFTSGFAEQPQDGHDAGHDAPHTRYALTGCVFDILIS